jgi:hypothetical protein
VKSEPTFRAVVFGDPHLALPAPASRDPATFQAETESLFEQVAEIARLSKADAVACPGDWFHLKGSTTHETVRWAMDLLRPIVKRYGPVLTVAGNHDMIGNNQDDSTQRQPIAVLEAAGLIHRVDLKAAEYEVGGQKFLVTGMSYPWKLFPKVRLPYLHLLHYDPDSDGYASAARAVRDDDERGSPWCAVNGHLHAPTDLNMDALDNGADHAFVPLGTLTRVSRPEADWVPRLAVVRLTKTSASYRFVSLRPTVPGLEGYTRDEAADTNVADCASLRQFAEYLSREGDKGDDPMRTLDQYLKDHPEGRTREGIDRARELLKECAT